MARYWMTSPRRLANERGLALGVVLLILVVILVLGTTLIGISVTEDQAGSIVADAKKAFSAADSGIQEVMYRLRLDPTTLTNEGNTVCSATADPVVIGFVQGGAHTVPIPDPTNASFWKYNPPACSWTYSGSSAVGSGNYFGGITANLDSAGRTFTSSGTSHVGVGALLASASPPNGVSYTVTVAPVVGFVDGCWQYVNQWGAPLGSCTTVAPNPMFKVTSTGTVKNAQKTLSVYLQKYAIKPPIEGALTANSYVNIQSASAVIDGDNFKCNGNELDPSYQSVKAVTVPDGAEISINKPSNLQCATGSGQGLEDCGGITPAFPSTLGGLLLGLTSAQEAASINNPSSDTYKLNSELDSIKIDPVLHPEQLPTSAFHGEIVYVNGDYQQPPDGSYGLLIVHNSNNNATLGNFNSGTFKGLIIADRINKINGTAQIIGGIIAFGPNPGVELDDLTGTPNVKYSGECLTNAYGAFWYKIVKGTFHEQ